MVAPSDGIGRTTIPATHKIVVKSYGSKGGISEEVHAGWIFAAVGNDRVEQRYLAEGHLKRNLIHPAKVNDMSAAQFMLFTACNDKIGRGWDVNTGDSCNNLWVTWLVGCSVLHPQEEHHHRSDAPRDILPGAQGHSAINVLLPAPQTAE